MNVVRYADRSDLRERRGELNGPRVHAPQRDGVEVLASTLNLNRSV
jgi:hypothetical protein